MTSRFKGPDNAAATTAAPQPSSRFKGPVSSDPVEAYDALPWYEQAAQAADDTVRLMANGMTFGQMDKFAAWAGNGSVEDERAKSADAKARAGTAGTADEILGAGMAAMYLPSWGSGLVGSMGTGATYGAIDGALRDADTWSETGMNTLEGLGAGAALGGAAHGIASGIGAGVDALGRLKRNWNLTPVQKAEVKIADMADARYGGPSAHVMANDLNKLGPEAARVDVLGEPGYAMTRRAANISPEARETVGNFAERRALGQNDRLTYDIQDIAGVPVGSGKSVDVMKREAYAAERPAIRSAYDAARTAGSDANLDLFKDLIDTDVGSKAFDQAFRNVSTRMTTGGDVAGGNLAVLDETARMLQGQAKQAFKNGDPMAEVYADLGKGFKERLDTLLMGDEYAVARAAREKAYKVSEAYDAGENLGRRSPTFDHLDAGGKVDPTNAPQRAAAYAQTKAEILSNSRPGNGTLGQFTTTGGQNASRIGLGDAGADTLAEAVSREQTFNRLPNALGNSTTVRQAEDIANPALEAAAAGVNLLTGGVTGAVTGLARAAAGRLGRHFSTQAQREAAPSTIQALLERGPLTPAKHLSPSRLQQWSKEADPRWGRRFMIGGPFGALEAERDQNSMAGAFR